MYTWNQLGSTEITNLYLYGSTTKPADLLNDGVLRAAGTTISVGLDAVSFMASGPGRFALGSQSTVVNSFMSGVLFQAQAGIKQTFNMQQAVAIAGSQSDLVGLQQYDYSDSTTDHAFRTYVYNSSSFKIASDVLFVIEADGTRHIENFSIRPFDDNFDFKSNNSLAAFGNPWLEVRVDPLGIGRTVKIVPDWKAASAGLRA